MSNKEVPVGTVRTRDGHLEWKCTTFGTWRKAVYHVDIRRFLIEEAGEAGTYTYERACGSCTDDVTAFHVGQKDWGITRIHWPDILFKYERDASCPRGQSAPIWKSSQGDVILYHKDNMPLLNFPEIPFTLSSKFEAPFIEAIMRLNPAIKTRDILVRMPANSKSSLNQISMRRTRFREKACMLSWGGRAGSDAKKAFMDTLLPAQCKATNSTRTFRDLTKPELNELQQLNLGKFPERKRHKNRASALTSQTQDVSQGESSREPKDTSATDQELGMKLEGDDSMWGFEEGEDTLEEDHDTMSIVANDQGDDCVRIAEFAAINVSSKSSIIDLSNEDEVSEDEEAKEDEEAEEDEEMEDSSETSSLMSVDSMSMVNESSTAEELDGIDDRKLLLYAKTILPAHRELVYHLLGPTRREFRSLTKQEPPASMPCASYISQYGDLQTALSSWYFYSVDKPKVPLLIGVLGLSDSELTWNRQDCPIVVGNVLGLWKEVTENLK